jgi:hypothetical protein
MKVIYQERGVFYFIGFLNQDITLHFMLKRASFGVMLP